MATILSVLIALLLLCCAAANHKDPDGEVFRVLEGPWSRCGRINASLACYRSREAACVRIADNRTAPWYYCNFTARPSELEACAQESCEQDCAVTPWSHWSSCDCNVGPFRSRSRSVVSPSRNGGRACPQLLERYLCEACVRQLSLEAIPRRHTWRTGQWGQCVPLELDSGCGLGLRNRSVHCINTAGQQVASSNCRQEPAYSELHPPSPQTLCEVSCSCRLGDWGEFTPCTLACHTSPPTGLRSRSRPILRHPTLGQRCLEPLQETQPCPLTTGPSPSTCPRYDWVASGWSPCSFQSDAATCGHGTITRYVYCVEIGKRDARRRGGQPVCGRRRCQACSRACLRGAVSPGLPSGGVVSVDPLRGILPADPQQPDASDPGALRGGRSHLPSHCGAPPLPRPRLPANRAWRL